MEQLSLLLPLDWIQISLGLRWHVGFQLSLPHSLWTLSIENAVQSWLNIDRHSCSYFIISFQMNIRTVVLHVQSTGAFAHLGATPLIFA